MLIPIDLVWPNWQVGWLGFNSIFSTNRLYCATKEVKVYWRCLFQI